MARRWMKSLRKDTLVCPSCHTELKHPSSNITTDYSFLCQSCQQTISISRSPSSPASTIRGCSPSSSLRSPTPGSPRPESFRSLAPSTAKSSRPLTASSLRSYNSGSTTGSGPSPTPSPFRPSTASSFRSYNTGSTNSFGPSPTPSIRINDAQKAVEVRSKEEQIVGEREEEEELTLAEEVVMGNVSARVWRARQIVAGRDPVQVVRRLWTEMMAKSAREMQDETEKMKETEKKVAKERGIRRANAKRRGG